MAEQNVEPQVEHPGPQIEQKPGTGVDRTLIRNMLALTPAERVKVLVASARNLAELLARARRV
jgi:hypothetical protein